MARDGGTHGDFRGLAISDLTDHYYVGILPKDGTESHWKGQSGERAHLDLIDAGALRGRHRARRVRVRRGSEAPGADPKA